MSRSAGPTGHVCPGCKRLTATPPCTTKLSVPMCTSRTRNRGKDMRKVEERLGGSFLFKFTLRHRRNPRGASHTRVCERTATHARSAAAAVSRSARSCRSKSAVGNCKLESTTGIVIALLPRKCLVGAQGESRQPASPGGPGHWSESASLGQVFSENKQKLCLSGPRRVGIWIGNGGLHSRAKLIGTDGICRRRHSMLNLRHRGLQQGGALTAGVLSDITGAFLTLRNCASVKCPRTQAYSSRQESHGSPLRPQPRIGLSMPKETCTLFILKTRVKIPLTFLSARGNSLRRSGQRMFLSFPLSHDQVLLLL